MKSMDFRQIELSISVNQVSSDETIEQFQFSMMIQLMVATEMPHRGPRDYPASESEIVQMMDSQISYCKDEVSDAVD